MVSTTYEAGVYEAKTHLSQLLDMVAQGATVTITRHGRKAAVLAPVPEPTTPVNRGFGIWPDYEIPTGWDDFTVEDESLWHGE